MHTGQKAGKVMALLSVRLRGFKYGMREATSREEALLTDILEEEGLGAALCTTGRVGCKKMGGETEEWRIFAADKTKELGVYIENAKLPVGGNFDVNLTMGGDGSISLEIGALSLRFTSFEEIRTLCTALQRIGELLNNLDKGQDDTKKRN